MQSYEDLYCKIFLDTNCEMEELIEMLLKLTNGQKKIIRTIVTEFGEIDVNANKEYSLYKKENTYDGFLYSKFFLDIQENAEISQEMYISKISELITILRIRKFKVVVACDFEEELRLSELNRNDSKP